MQYFLNLGRGRLLATGCRHCFILIFLCPCQAWIYFMFYFDIFVPLLGLDLFMFYLIYLFLHRALSSFDALLCALARLDFSGYRYVLRFLGLLLGDDIVGLVIFYF